MKPDFDNANVGKNESYHTRVSIIRVFFYFIQGREKPMREYKTQMEAARKGIVTEELKKVAQKEHLRVEELMPLVAAGKVAICANKNHKCLDPQGVGSMLRTKINVNLGVSRDWIDYDIEMQKVMAAVDMGADAIMDLSSHGDTTGFRR